MNNRIRVAVAVCVLLFAACQRGGASARGTGEGTIVSIDPAKAEITIDHGDIPDVMMGMTMAFTASDPRLLEGLTPGAPIEFDVEQRGERYFVTGIRARKEAD